MPSVDEDMEQQKLFYIACRSENQYTLENCLAVFTKAKYIELYDLKIQGTKRKECQKMSVNGPFRQEY